MEFIMETPANIKELVNDANCKTSWETRLNALNELKKYDCQQVRDVVTRLALHDRIFNIKREAFLVAQALKITKGGNPIRLTKRENGYKQSDYTKLFTRIKREQMMEFLDVEKFKQAWEILNPEMLDTIKFEKRKNLDKWIEDTFKTLPKNKPLVSEQPKPNIS